MNNEKMSESTRAELLDVLGDLMQEHPDWRIGQLISNIAFLANQRSSATWDVGNEEFVQAGKLHLQRMAERGQTLVQTGKESSRNRQKAAV